MNDNDIIQANQVAIMRAFCWLLRTYRDPTANFPGRELTERANATEAHLYAKLNPDRTQQSFQDGRGTPPQTPRKPPSDIT